MTNLSLPPENIINTIRGNKTSSISKPLLSFLSKDFCILTSIFTVGFLLRLLLVAYVAPYPDRFIQTDAIGYNQIAVNLLTGNGFSKEVEPPYLPDNFRTPVYTLILALYYTFFGLRPEYLLFTQAFLGSVTILAVFYMAKLITNSKIALLAAGLFAVSTHSITYTALLWSDTLFTLLLTVTIVMTIHMLKNQTAMKWVYLSSLTLGLATLSHPRSLYLPIFFAAILLIVRLKNNLPLKQIFIHLGVYILIFNLILVPWRIRNYVVFGVPNITSASGVNMYFYGAALMEASQTGEEHWEVVDRYERVLSREGAFALNEARSSQLAFDLALKKISEHPISYLRAHIIGSLKVFLPSIITLNYLLTGQNHEYRENPFSLMILNPLTLSSINDTTTQYPLILWAYFLFTIGHLLLIYTLIIYAFIQKWKNKWSWFLLMIIIYLAIVAGPAGTPRFQLPIIPALSVLAAFPFFYRKIKT
jgi:4-amino-4-deoxy-L-arabinose transferase-like glycosyltransferase